MASRALAPPDYGQTGIDHVRVTLRRHGLEDREMRQWMDTVLGGGASVHEEAAAVIAKREGAISVARLHAATGQDSDLVREVLRGLVVRGVLRQEGPESFVLHDAPVTPAGIDLQVMELLSPSEASSIQDLALATGRSTNSLRPVLRRLVASGRVVATAPPQSRRRRYLRSDSRTAGG